MDRRSPYASTSPHGFPEVEYQNYFCGYENFEQHREMLEDVTRMKAYHAAIFGNALHFAGKVVLDVGCGTGILSLFAAKAGARKVYAVEATKCARLAKELVASNGVANTTVTVIEGMIEEIELPEKVDIIVSEFMGHFLLRESMIDCVLVARDRFLKPEGAMYPSSAKMLLAPVTCREEHAASTRNFQAAANDWGGFVESCKRDWDIDFSIISSHMSQNFRNEFLYSSEEVHLQPSAFLGDAVCVKEIDLLTATLEDAKQVSHSFAMPITKAGKGHHSLDAFLGWFSVRFDGSPQNPSLRDVELSSGPCEVETTHWGQEAFMLHPPAAVQSTDVVEGSLSMARRRDNWRTYNIEIEYKAYNAKKPEGKSHRAGYILS